MYDLADMLTVIYKYKKLYEKRCSGIMKQHDLKAVDIDILYYITHSGSRNLSKDIVDMGISKAHVSKSVDHLRQKGFVVLLEDQEDRRCLHIEPTGSAREMAQEIGEIRARIQEEISKGLTEEDKEAVVRAVQKLSQNINREIAEMSERPEQTAAKA